MTLRCAGPGAGAAGTDVSQLWAGGIPAGSACGTGEGWRDEGLKGWRDDGMKGWRDEWVEGGGMKGWSHGGMQVEPPPISQGG